MAFKNVGTIDLGDKYIIRLVIDNDGETYNKDFYNTESLDVVCVKFQAILEALKVEFRSSKEVLDLMDFLSDYGAVEYHSTIFGSNTGLLGKVKQVLLIRIPDQKVTVSEWQ